MRENGNITREGDFWLVRDVRKPPRITGVSPGCVWDSNAKAKPTLVRALPSDAPPASLQAQSVRQPLRWPGD